MRCAKQEGRLPCEHLGMVQTQAGRSTLFVEGLRPAHTGVSLNMASRNLKGDLGLFSPQKSDSQLNEIIIMGEFKAVAFHLTLG